jgi:hypothetical protein
MTAPLIPADNLTVSRDEANGTLDVHGLPADFAGVPMFVLGPDAVYLHDDDLPRVAQTAHVLGAVLAFLAVEHEDRVHVLANQTGLAADTVARLLAEGWTFNPPTTV